MKFNVAFLLIAFLLISCGTATNSHRELDQTPGISPLDADILRCEDERNPHALLQMAASLNFDRVRLASRLAIASGRIPSFKTWRLLALQFGKETEVAESLAVAARFPDNKFPTSEVVQTLLTLPPSAAIVETLIYLDTPDAFQVARSIKPYQNVVARNLWRSKSQINKEILSEYYQRFPVETVYSIGRTETRGILKTDDLKRLPWHQRMAGCPVADYPDALLGDPAWPVRVIAARSMTESGALFPLLKDPNPLVRQTALEKILKLDAEWVPPDLYALTPREAELVAASPSTDMEVVRRLFQRGGIFAEVTAPFMPGNSLPALDKAGVSDRARIRFLQKAMGEGRAIEEALRIFRNSDSAYALEYLLRREKGVDGKAIAEEARRRGKFTSVLVDLGLGVPAGIRRPASFYTQALKDLGKYRGFTIFTDRGNLECVFFPRSAPLTCANFIQLTRDGYFNNLRIHRVVPAFVTQDGDPSGTGSGGPGHTIRCEYNRLKYDRAGRVGMALSGKDTGGSQYFMTHAPAPHLNHRYTIFAQVERGLETLARISQYDRILRITLR